MSNGTSDPYQRLELLGLTLPTPAAPKGSYSPLVECDKLLFLSGALPILDDGTLLSPGICGESIEVEAAARAAQLCALHLVSRLHEHLGSLVRVERIVKAVGFVASAPTFMAQPTVINGASDLFVEVFGDKGVHARSAVGVSALPLGSSVEVEAIVKISR